MNYHNREWIMYNVYKHYVEAKRIIPKESIIGIFLQGSQNYGLDYQNSDIDTKCIITPTFREIVLNKKPHSYTHILENDEHIDIKDIRLYIQTFRKQNLNFLEILFTDYCWFPNTEYITQWNRLVENRERIARFDKIRSIKSMMGIASEKYFAMEHHYPSRMEWIEKYGYDPKQLHHLLRVGEYLNRYIAGEPYSDCLISKQAEHLKKVKQGFYSLEEARKIADETYKHIHTKCDEYCEKHKNEPIDKEMDELLDDVSYEIMKISVKKEI